MLKPLYPCNTASQCDLQSQWNDFDIIFAFSAKSAPVQIFLEFPFWRDPKMVDIQIHTQILWGKNVYIVLPLGTFHANQNVHIFPWWWNFVINIPFWHFVCSIWTSLEAHSLIYLLNLLHPYAFENALAFLFLELKLINKNHIRNQPISRHYLLTRKDYLANKFEC